MAGRNKRKVWQNIKWFFGKIPTIIWGAFAVLGIFLFGVSVGLAFPVNDPPKDSENISRNVDYRKVIDSYQSLSRLFYFQQQDMDIIADSSRWRDDPQELSDALESYKRNKDEIFFQFGRIYELRHNANLPDDENLKSN